MKYACMNFHYAKRIPHGANIAYSVFNDYNEWCGVIVFGYPSTNGVVKQFGIPNGSILELRRVALNSKHGVTSKALALAMKLLKKDCPLVKLLVSYSDKGQNHYGIIYQATNWHFVGESNSSGVEYLIDGKWMHSRWAKSDIKRKVAGKRKYIYPLHKSMVEYCKSMSKPYPKKQHAHEVNEDKRNASCIEIEGANPIHAL